jgi:pyruvate dehydrogenase E2 component (dihydrolipoamide acetyltransferase)
MAEAVIMPKAGMAMEEGTILQWFKSEGDSIEKGEAIAEIETDKLAMDLEADFSGTLLKIVRNEGEVVPVIETIAWIGEPGEEIPESAPAAPAPQAASEEPSGQVSEPVAASATTPTPAVADVSSLASPGTKIPSTPAAKRVARESGVQTSHAQATGPRGVVTRQDVERLAQATAGVSATPLARKAAQIDGVDLTPISGSGYGGKVRRVDLSAARTVRQTQSLLTRELRKMGRVQKIMAKRMSESHATIPPSTLHTHADVTELLAIRPEINEQLAPVKTTVTDYVIRAVACALHEHPIMNTQINGDAVQFMDQVNIGLAVASPDGLLVPVLKNADRLSLEQTAIGRGDLVNRARGGRLSPDDFAEGTFTVTNLGMYGIETFTPVIMPPQTAILGVGAAIEQIALGEGGAHVVRRRMALSLTIDHRVIDGGQAALFLSDVRQRLETIQL